MKLPVIGVGFGTAGNWDRIWGLSRINLNPHKAKLSVVYPMVVEYAHDINNGSAGSR